MNELNFGYSRTPISDQVYSYIKGEILKGNWKPGEKIPSENMLCKTLGVSRVSVRAAIKKLASIGLIESFQGKGTFVCKEGSFQPINDLYSIMALSQSDRMSMLEFRKIIEIASAGFAAMRASTEFVNAMNDSILKLEAADNPKDIIKYGLEFHRQIMLATNNSLIIRTFEMLHEVYLQAFEEHFAVIGEISVSDHRAILSAIETRNAELARKLMEEHLNNTTKSMVEARFWRQ